MPRPLLPSPSRLRPRPLRLLWLLWLRLLWLLLLRSELPLLPETLARVHAHVLLRLLSLPPSVLLVFSVLVSYVRQALLLLMPSAAAAESARIAPSTGRLAHRTSLSLLPLLLLRLPSLSLRPSQSPSTRRLPLAAQRSQGLDSGRGGRLPPWALAVAVAGNCCSSSAVRPVEDEPDARADRS